MNRARGQLSGDEDTVLEGIHYPNCLRHLFRFLSCNNNVGQGDAKINIYGGPLDPGICLGIKGESFSKTLRSGTLH